MKKAKEKAEARWRRHDGLDNKAEVAQAVESIEAMTLDKI